MRVERPVLVAVMGATASGKTEFAEALATTLDAQLVNADAFQVYRGLDIGTAKPRDRGRYRLLDLIDPDQPFGVGAWVGLAQAELESLWEQRRSAVVVGGTGLYVRALFEEYAQMQSAPDPGLRADLLEAEAREGPQALRERLRKLDPEAFDALDTSNPVRVRRALERLFAESPPRPVQLPPYSKVKVCIERESDQLDRRIRARVDAMFAAGWEDEVRTLRASGHGPDAPGMRAIGYREVGGIVDGSLDRAAAVEAIVLATRRYAKRQRTWLRSEPQLERVGSGGSASMEAALSRIREAARS